MKQFKPNYTLRDTETGFILPLEVGMRSTLSEVFGEPDGWGRVDEDTVEYIGFSSIKPLGANIAQSDIIPNDFSEVNGSAKGYFLDIYNKARTYDCYVLGREGPDFSEEELEVWSYGVVSGCTSGFGNPVIVWRLHPEKCREKTRAKMRMRLVVIERADLPPGLLEQLS